MTIAILIVQGTLSDDESDVTVAEAKAMDCVWEVVTVVALALVDDLETIALVSVPDDKLMVERVVGMGCVVGMERVVGTSLKDVLVVVEGRVVELVVEDSGVTVDGAFVEAAEVGS